MGELRELIERVEKATGPDRELDGAIEVQARRFLAYAAGLNDATRAHWKHNRATVYDGNTGYDAERYTASVDAALALVEKVLPGWACGFDAGVKTRIAFVDRHDHADRIFGAQFTAEAPTICLAILSALLRAIDNQGAGR